MKGRKKRKLLYVKFWVCCIVITFMSSFLPVCKVSAAGLKLYFDRENVDYAGKQVSYKLNNTVLNKKGYPGIIIGSISLVPAKDILTNKKIGISYTYSESKKQITLKKDSTTIIMKLDSVQASVNGTKTILPLAPRKVTYLNKKATKILVPARFVFQNFGYQYTWNSAASTVSLQAPDSGLKLYYDGKWRTYGGVKGTVSVNEKQIDVKNMPAILLQNVVTVQAKKIFGSKDLGISYTYNKTSKKITLIQDKTKVVMSLNSKKALVNNEEVMLDGPVRMVKNKKNNCSYVMVPCKSLCRIFDLQYKWTGKEAVIGTKDTPSGEDVIRIPRPEGIHFSDIMDEDLYLQKKIKITIPGNYKEFYSKNTIDNFCKNVTNISVENKKSKKTEIIVSTSKIQGYRIKENKKYFEVQVADPSRIYDRIVVLDPGHGGKQSPGATAVNGMKEKDITYQIMYVKAKEYFNGPDSPVKAYWTRTDDTFVPLADLAAFAKKVQADFYISLHLNSASPAAYGTEIHYSKYNNKPSKTGLTSKALGEILCEHLIEELGTKNRGVLDRESNLAVTKKNSVPACLIELGFISNQNELEKILDDDFQDRAVRAIYEAVNDVFEQYPTGR